MMQKKEHLSGKTVTVLTTRTGTSVNRTIGVGIPERAGVMAKIVLWSTRMVSGTITYAHLLTSLLASIQIPKLVQQQPQKKQQE